VEKVADGLKAYVGKAMKKGLVGGASYSAERGGDAR
jgi:hypothetical protein